MGFTHTISRDSESATREPNSNPADKPPVRSRRSAMAWIAVAVALLAVVVLGFATLAGSSSDEPALPSWRDTAKAEEIERQAHLDGQARTYGADTSTASERAPYVPVDRDGFVPGTRSMPL